MTSPAPSRAPLKLYPDVPNRRSKTIFADVVVVALLVFFAWIAMIVHDAVDQLSVLGNGVKEGGLSVQHGFGSAADQIRGVPLVGGNLADALQGAGSASGGNVAALGKEGADSVHHLALVLGLVVFVLPALLLLAVFVPRRVRQIRRLTAAAGVLAYPNDQERVRLLAMRAVFGLPYGTLATYTRDPFGDLAEARYDPLLQAVFDDAGIRPGSPP